MFNSFGACQGTYLTATAATAITWLMPPRSRAFSRIKRTRYRSGTTAHNLYWMKTFGSPTTASSAAAASQAVINITADPGLSFTPGAIAASDWLCFELADGTFLIDKIASVATLAITMTTNFPTGGVAAGGRVWTFGALANHATSQTTSLVSPLKGSTELTVASSTQDFDGGEGGIVQSQNQNEPLMFYSDNGTAAGFLELISGTYDQN